ncbi:MAG: fibronectin type III domain-containing protein [Planctomycetota bacterium]
MLTHIGKVIVLTTIGLFAIVLALKLFVDGPVQRSHDERIVSVHEAVTRARDQGWSSSEGDPWNRSPLPDHVGDYRSGRLRPFDLGATPDDIFYSEEEIRPAGEAPVASSLQLDPPQQVQAVASLSGIDLVWSPDADNDALDVGYLVYRWSGIERPEALMTQPSSTPVYHDDQVESDREYRYAILSVLERDILGVRTRVRSAWSEVLTVRSAQTRRIRFADLESEGEARFLVEVHHGGAWQTQAFLVTLGDRIGRDVDGLPFGSDYRLLALDERMQEVPKSRQVVAFDRDGRVQVSEESGEPAYVEVTEMEQEIFSVAVVERRSSRETLELRAGEGPPGTD